VVGNYASPDTPGSAYVLLHHVFGEVNGKKGAWGHAVGGMGAITRRWPGLRGWPGSRSALRRRSRRCWSMAARRGRAAGKRRGNRARRIVAANVGPALLYRQMVDPSDLAADFNRRIKGFKTGSGTFRMNVALSELPDFTCLPGKASRPSITPPGSSSPRARLHGPGLHRCARQHGWSKAPIVEMLIPSTVDDSLAPPGCHVASLFCQQFAPAPDRPQLGRAREEVADLIIDTVTAMRPISSASVIARQIHSPLDLERKFGLIGGDIMHGTMGLDQLWAARPVLGHGDYRGPIKGSTCAVRAPIRAAA
jgi:phytoene dehydrogenase-like protein